MSDLDKAKKEYRPFTTVEEIEEDIINKINTDLTQEEVEELRQRLKNLFKLHKEQLTNETYLIPYVKAIIEEAEMRLNLPEDMIIADSRQINKKAISQQGYFKITRGLQDIEAEKTIEICKKILNPKEGGK